MVDWRSFVKNDTLEWLLEEKDPSVRYYTLIDLLDKNERNREVANTKKYIMEAGLVPEILKSENEGGYWVSLNDFYERTKYRGTVWTLILLAELNADGRHKGIKGAVENIFQQSQDRESGGFAHEGSRSYGGHHSKVIPCLTGNMVWCMLRLGYGNDPRVKKGVK